MATTESSKDDRDDLKKRVDELEEIVAEQRETMKKMLPDRRQFLKGAGAGGLAAVGGLSLLGQASQQSEAAKGDQGIGTSTDPWPVGYFDYLEASNAEVDSLTANLDLTAAGLNISNDPTNPTEYISHGATDLGSRHRTVAKTFTADGTNKEVLDVARAGLVQVAANPQGTGKPAINAVFSVVGGGSYTKIADDTRSSPTHSFNWDVATLEISVSDGGSTWVVEATSIEKWP